MGAYSFILTVMIKLTFYDNRFSDSGVIVTRIFRYFTRTKLRSKNQVRKRFITDDKAAYFVSSPFFF